MNSTSCCFFWLFGYELCTFLSLVEVYKICYYYKKEKCANTGFPKKTTHHIRHRVFQNYSSINSPWKISNIAYRSSNNCVTPLQAIRQFYFSIKTLRIIKNNFFALPRTLKNTTRAGLFKGTPAYTIPQLHSFRNYVFD